MNKSYLLIGGNEGDRIGHLAEARLNIELYCGPVTEQSSIYETAAWGKTDQADFLNQALLLLTSLTAPALMTTLLEIERKMGRSRGEKWGSRVIDIDILFFNTDIVNLPQLVIPHPEIWRRRFALAPMVEIAAQYVHPVLHKNIHQLLEECPDKLDVKKMSAIS
jgi:2-amino-4-hydroxy-6-hydroxymethyldihydropteridine diphosphokinase